MVVDDQKAATAMWRLLLERTGVYVVREENRGRRALASAREFAPDLILLDLNMPDLDGTEVALGVTRDRTLQGTPILFITSLVSESEAAGGKRIDGFPCVAKPISLDVLVASIERQLAFQGRAAVGTLAALAA